MLANADRNHRLQYCWLVIPLAWVLSRAYFYTKAWDPMLELLSSADLGLWFFPAHYVKDNLAESILYLRANAPFSQLFFGVLAKVVGWPFLVPWSSFFLSFIVLLNSLLVYRILVLLGFPVLLSVFSGFVLCLSPDFIVCELHGLPGSFYEVCSSFFIAVSVYFFTMAVVDSGRRHVWLGVFCLAVNFAYLSMASLSYFCVVPIIAILLLADPGRRWLYVAFSMLSPVLWMLKNWWVYGYVEWGFSSLSGMYFLVGLANAGLIDHFWDWTKDRKDMAGIDCFVISIRSGCFSPEQIAGWAKLENVYAVNDGFPANGFLPHTVSRFVMSQYPGYVLHHPGDAVTVFVKSTVRFWENARSGIRTFDLVLYDALFKALTFINIAVRYFSCLSYYLVSIPLALVAAFLVVRGRNKEFFLPFLYMFLAFSYVYVLTSLVNFGENNRHRVATLPVMWLLPFVAWQVLGFFRRIRRGESISRWGLGG